MKLYLIEFKTHGKNYRIAIETVKRPDGSTGAKMVESLLKTDLLETLQVMVWNSAIDFLESMMIVQVCNGVDITSSGYIEGVKCYVVMLENRLSLF